LPVDMDDLLKYSEI